jgi:hypothetical protein
MKSESEISKALAELNTHIHGIRLIDEKLRAFNVFEVLRVQRRELQHSNFLAYLLDPSARHGLGVAFLEDFLRLIIKHNTGSEKSREWINKLDLKASYVVREWESKDILILNAKLRFVCIIENKIGSKERLHQLEGYRRRIEEQYPNRKKLFVFLTPDKSEACDPKWSSLGYLEVVNLLRMLLDRHGPNLDYLQRSVIEQYLDVLRRHVVKDTELVKQARNLYVTHQTALDFIFENKPSYVTSLHEHLSGFISKRKELRLDAQEPKYFRFVPREWDKILNLKTKRGWEDGSLIACELETPDSEARILNLHIVLHMHGSMPNLKLGRSIYERIEKKKLRSKSEFLWACRKRIPVPSEFSDDFNECVAEDVASYIRDDLPKITAEIKKAVAAFDAAVRSPPQNRKATISRI